jgi:acetoin utilization deacetylase AcuC-like enzyme
VKTFWSAAHRGHRPAHELIDGHLAPHVEVPERAELVLEAVTAAGLGDVVDVDADEAEVRAAAERVHDSAFVAFLAGAWDEWQAEGRDWDALPIVWRVPALDVADRPEPVSIDGKLSRWSFDAGTPIGAGTWRAVVGSAGCALAAAAAVSGGDGSAFALCRPPGHHAARAAYGGYCYLNNSAIAAQHLRSAGAERVAVLDVDYHHGNGTQAIFWERADVVTVSIHADPRQEYPYFLGHADETGAGAGEGANLNLPLPWGTGYEDWAAALERACTTVAGAGVAALVVPLGVDTHEADPISRFRLRTSDYPAVGARIAALGLPTVVVLEGGYATSAIGANVTGVLRAFT